VSGQERSKLFHPRIIEDVVLCAVNKVKPDNQPDENHAILFVFIEE
jgi:hypothetical protein